MNTQKETVHVYAVHVHTQNNCLTNAESTPIILNRILPSETLSTSPSDPSSPIPLYANPYDHIAAPFAWKPPLSPN